MDINSMRGKIETHLWMLDEDDIKKIRKILEQGETLEEKMEVLKEYVDVKGPTPYWIETLRLIYVYYEIEKRRREYRAFLNSEDYKAIMKQLEEE